MTAERVSSSGEILRVPWSQVFIPILEVPDLLPAGRDRPTQRPSPPVPVERSISL